MALGVCSSGIATPHAICGGTAAVDTLFCCCPWQNGSSGSFDGHPTATSTLLIEGYGEGAVDGAFGTYPDGGVVALWTRLQRPVASANWFGLVESGIEYPSFGS